MMRAMTASRKWRIALVCVAVSFVIGWITFALIRAHIESGYGIGILLTLQTPGVLIWALGAHTDWSRRQELIRLLLVVLVNAWTYYAICIFIMKRLELRKRMETTDTSK
jgi:hypothetical protein